MHSHNNQSRCGGPIGRALWRHSSTQRCLGCWRIRRQPSVGHACVPSAGTNHNMRQPRRRVDVLLRRLSNSETGSAPHPHGCWPRTRNVDAVAPLRSCAASLPLMTPAYPSHMGCSKPELPLDFSRVSLTGRHQSLHMDPRACYQSCANRHMACTQTVLEGAYTLCCTATNCAAATAHSLQYLKVTSLSKRVASLNVTVQLRHISSPQRRQWCLCPPQTATRVKCAQERWGQ